MPKKTTLSLLAVALAVAAGVAGTVAVRAADAAKPVAATAAPKPALTVNVTRPQATELPLVVEANGSLHAWQEASIGAEANGLRIAEVRVNVGDRVRRGQVLASFAPELLRADLAQIRAAVAEAEALLAEAAANAVRARDLEASGALSAQQIAQFLTAERTAAARLEAQRAAARVQELRLAQTQVLAPDDGIISARTATVGAVVPAGQELFRLIRQGRLEWRAEVAAAELARIAPGQKAQVVLAGGTVVNGTVRMVAPTVDAATRNGLIYIDLAANPQARAGMFARGTLEIGLGQGSTLPQTAVLMRDGFAWVFLVGADNKVRAQKVALGRRMGDRVEVKTALPSDAQVVAAGGGFLADGDLVKVVPAKAAAAPIDPPASRVAQSGTAGSGVVR